MQQLRKSRAWRIAMDGHTMTVHPAHAFPFIEQRDRELQQRGAAYWCVGVWRLESDEPITLDHWCGLDRERLSLQVIDCEFLREHHPIPDMRAIYDHCLVYLDHELHAPHDDVLFPLWPHFSR